MGEELTLPDTVGHAARSAPGVLIPWLAAGVGLVALAIVPHNGSTDPAGAATPPRIAAEAAVGPLMFATSLETLPLELEGAGVGVPTATAMLDGAIIRWAEQLTSRSEALGSEALGSEAQGAGAADLEQPMWTARSLGRTPDSLAASTPTDLQWSRLRWCESSDNYQAENESGRYRGAYQFDIPTWESVGGEGDPASAPPDEQDARARELFDRRGSSPWPFCGRHLEPNS